MNSTPNPDRRSDRRREADPGSTLVLILVLLVIAGMIVVPTLGYAITVLRHNRALSGNTAKAEAAKAGLRVALGDPRSLYETCTSASPQAVPLPQLDIQAVTTCELLYEVTRYQPGELPWDVATAYYGVAPPPAGLIEGQAFDSAGSETYADWLNYATQQRIAAPTQPGFESARSIWLPSLATRTVTPRASGGFAMPAGAFNSNYASCTVFFPGTYPDPVTITGPTYFTSGQYYFEATVTFGPGASVVMGSGQHEGCTDDQRAAFSAIGVPSTHNITGVGATVVLGLDGRLDIDDAGVGPVDFRMNTRYVAPEDTSLRASEEVSIISVNGAVDDQGNGIATDIAGGLFVPAGLVGGDTPHLATDDGYAPSRLVAVPTAPNPPTGVVVDVFDGSLAVSWQPSVGHSLAAVTGYEVTAVASSDPNEVSTCATPDFRLGCALVGLTNGETYVVSVRANSDTASSPPSAVVSSTPTVADPPVTGPGPPTPTSSIEVFDDAVRFEWAPPSDVGATPITGYTVEVPAVYDAEGNVVFAAATCSSDGRFNECATPIGTADPDLVAANPDLAVRVRADTGFGTRWSDPVPQTPVRRAGQSYSPPTIEPTAAPPQTAPIVRVKVSAGQAVTVDVPGYVAVPQGWVEIDRAPAATGSVRLDGAVLASWLAIAGCETGGCVIGQANEPTQRVVRLRTTVAGDAVTRSDAVVQINSNGAWAVNSWEVQRLFSAP